MPRRTRLPFALASIAALLLATTGCKDRSKSADESGATTSREQAGEAFTWRTALAASPAEAAEALGSYRGCAPEERLPPPTPQNRQFLLGGAPWCRFGEGRDLPPEAYHIDGLLFSEGTAVAISLAPTDSITRDEVHEAFDLPELPVVRRRAVGHGDERRYVRAARARSFELEKTGVIGVDIFSRPETSDRVESVVIWASVRWSGLFDAVPVSTFEAGRGTLDLPATTGGLDVRLEGLYLQIGLDEAKVAQAMEVPEIGDFEREELTAAGAFETARLGGESGRKPLGKLLETWRERRHARGEVPEDLPSIIAVDRLLPAPYLTQILEASSGGDIGSFELVARHMPTLDTPRTPYLETVTDRLIYAPAPRDDRPGSQTVVEMRPDGITVYFGGTKVGSVGNCPERGPTLCPADDSIDIAKQLERARELRREGSLEDSDRLAREALSAYDWAGLYEMLVRIRDTHSRERTITLSVRGDLPLVVLTHALDIARYRRGSDGCKTAFEDSAALLAAEACQRDGRPSALFEQLAVTGELAELPSSDTKPVRDLFETGAIRELGPTEGDGVGRGESGE